MTLIQLWFWCLTAVKVYEKDPFQVFVVNQGSMDTWTWLMVDGEITPIWVPSKQVVLLFIYDQFLQGETVSVLSSNNLCKQSTNISVPLSHNSTVLLPTEKLKSQGECCSCTGWKPCSHWKPQCARHLGQIDCQARIWCDCTNLTHTILAISCLYTDTFFTHAQVGQQASSYLYQFVSLHYI